MTGREKNKVGARETEEWKQEGEGSFWAAPGNHGPYPVLTSAGSPAGGALPQGQWLGDRPRDRQIHKGARKSASAKEPHSICKNQRESAFDNSNLSGNGITFTILGKIKAGNGNSEETPAEVTTLVFIGI